ncbi:putative glutamyl-tRNA amidotransferase subunit A [Teratosphaeria nubilosa]|uniref:amidase n=1 Tax=Teratosphaeria nubilosa TaxID=161662 RepID=A0A6G1LAQ2_9PEZI|nr:putative glutamyl-tRNA amidotransferase subunit A [Teratosphaeria nubilosa]
MSSLSSQRLSWRDISTKMMKHRDGSIAKVQPRIPDVPRHLPSNVTGIPKQLLSKEVIAITESKPEDLLAKLTTGKISSVAVTNAFLQRAGLASKLTNCVTELLPDQALARAKECDDYFARYQKPIGPLHGLPISVKEHVGMKGLDNNAGFVGWVGMVAEDDALLLKLLWKAGAVFHVRTTQPQTLMHLETSNNIYGVTVNPYNRSLSSGGSSGGEGALLGMRGSCLGIGTDIGGSIRSPAANNGLFGFRPTTYRLPLGGLAFSMQGSEHIVAVIGPLSTSLEGIKAFTKAIIDQQPWLYDPMLTPMPWRYPAANQSTLLRRGTDGRRKLRIGVLADDGIVRPHPPILRGIRTLVDSIKHHPDVEIVEFPPYKHDEAWRIISSLYFADNAADEKRAIQSSGEPWRPLSEFIIKENPNVRDLTIADAWALQTQRNDYKAAYARHWNSVNTSLPGPESRIQLEVNASKEMDRMVDVILTPTGPGVAPQLDTSKYWGYTAQWNLLDYPCMVFPTGLHVSAKDDPMEAGYVPRNEKDRYNYDLYSPEAYVDAPISLQLVGRRYTDEKVIEALEFILEIAGKTPDAKL